LDGVVNPSTRSFDENVVSSGRFLNSERKSPIERMTPKEFDELKEKIDQHDTDLRGQLTEMVSLRQRMAEQAREIVALQDGLSKLRSDLRDGLEVLLKDSQKQLEAIRRILQDINTSAR
jgi:septal ring factor EnvC (AmiA/AmiB activator)